MSRLCPFGAPSTQPWRGHPPPAPPEGRRVAQRRRPNGIFGASARFSQADPRSGSSLGNRMEAGSERGAEHGDGLPDGRRPWTERRELHDLGSRACHVPALPLTRRTTTNRASRDYAGGHGITAPGRRRRAIRTPSHRCRCIRRRPNRSARRCLARQESHPGALDHRAERPRPAGDVCHEHAADEHNHQLLHDDTPIPKPASPACCCSYAQWPVAVSGTGDPLDASCGETGPRVPGTPRGYGSWPRRTQVAPPPLLEQCPPLSCHSHRCRRHNPPPHSGRWCPGATGSGRCRS